MEALARERCFAAAQVAARRHQPVARGEEGRTYAREAGSALLDLMKDDDDDVRQQAEQCLKRIVSYLEARAQLEQQLETRR